MARLQIVEPPFAIIGIDQPHGGIDGATLAGIQEPPSGIVLMPKDTLKVTLAPVPTGKDKSSTCAADVLVVGRTYGKGQ